MVIENDFPRPLRPTNLRSLNLATWFFITAVQLRSSPHQFSSFPALIVTIVPSGMSSKATTLKAHGRLLFDRQWFGSAEQRIDGEPVVTSSPWYSCSSSWRFWYMSFMIEVPIDSGVLAFSGDAGDEATAVAPSLFGKCIFDGVSRVFTFDAIMIDFERTSGTENVFSFHFCL